MRTLSSPTIAVLANREALEPINIVSVQWGGPGGNFIEYADKADLGIPGKILEFGNIDDMQRSDSSGTTSAVTLTLDDIDGSLKTMFNGTDLHKKIANVYQSFVGLTHTDRFLVLSGQVSTPIIWDEGARTLTFDIVSKLEDQEVGYSAEMGIYPLIPYNLMGAAWPIVFGTVQHIPALQLQNIPMAFTAEPFGIVDRSINTQLQYLNQQIADLLNKWTFDSLDAAGNAVPSGSSFLADPSFNNEAYQSLQEQIFAIGDQIRALNATNAGQGVWARGSVHLLPSVNVTQPFSGTVKCGNNLFSATINNFTGQMSCIPLRQPGDFTGQILKQGFQFYDAGTPVTIASAYPLMHIVSLIPGSVIRVWAMRSSKGLKQMAVVPTDYYTVGSFTYSTDRPAAVTVTLKQPLSTISLLTDIYNTNWENSFGQYLPSHQVPNVDWEDQIYVTFQSSIGPNFVDIAIWLITNYTTNSYDTTSFNHVRDKVAAVPMNFALFNQQNVVSLLTDLAYQARCVIFLREDVFYLIFLPEIPTTGSRVGQLVSTDLVEDDIQVGSLQVTCTPTESLVTKYTASFRPDYSPVFQEPVRMIYRYNIPKYGMHAEEHDFYAYNTYQDVEKAATFWLIRKSMTWKIIRCKIFVTRLDLEVFDAVTLNFSKPYVASAPVIGIITALKYNSAEHIIDVEIWTPVRLGEMVPYNFAWPYSATETDIWPPYREIQAGSAGGLSGGSPLPGSNSPRIPIGIPGDLPELGTTPSDAGPGFRYRWDTGDPNPGNEGNSGAGANQRPLPDPTDQRVPHTPTPVGSPAFDYTYSVFSATNPVPASYPAVIEKKLESTTGGGAQTYEVTAYPDTLSGKAVTLSVEQLQIDKDDEIPKGTWVIVCQTVGQEDDPSSTKTPKAKRFIIRRYIQVPIWIT